MDSKHKTYFLGPKAENEAWVRAEIQGILEYWFRWRKGLFPDDPQVISTEEALSTDYLRERSRLTSALNGLNQLLEAEVPKFPPRYMGHMVSELALPALFGHLATLLHNPNNTSTEASKIGSLIEDDLIKMLSTMVGYDPEKATGHVTGGGTIANFEAIWRARFRQDHWLALALYLAEEKDISLRLFEAAHMGWKRFTSLVVEHDIDVEELRGYSASANNPYHFAERMSRCFDISYRGPVILVPQNKHYSWQKGTNIFGFGESAFWPVELDEFGKLDVASLQSQIARARVERRPILMVVSVAGTTETGEVDPVHKVCETLADFEKENGWDIWHHVDAAYGGFMCSMLRGPEGTPLTDENEAALAALGQAHSVTIDPHKQGYVPYACGAILVKDEECYTVSSFKAPYLDRTGKLDRWSTTLEGSRAATGAAATWLTGQSLGFDASGLGGIIAQTILACGTFKVDLQAKLPFVQPLEPTDTNILCFAVAEKGDAVSLINARTEALYDLIHESVGFSVSKTTLTLEQHGRILHRHLETYDAKVDDDKLVLIRCVFMNPFWGEAELARKLTDEFIELLEGWYKSQVVK